MSTDHPLSTYLNYCSCVLYNHLLLYILYFFVFLCVVFSPHVFFFFFLPHYGNEERADLTTEQPDELHFHGLSRLLVTSHCLFSFSVYLVKNCDNKKRLLLPPLYECRSPPSLPLLPERKSPPLYHHYTSTDYPLSTTITGAQITPPYHYYLSTDHPLSTIIT